MAGIYIHIPFCKSRCVYCDFYSTTSLSLSQRYVDALCQELSLRANYLHEPVRTIYIGGGTPSQLFGKQLRQLFDAVGTAEEVTLECNPDDVTDEFAELLSVLPVNRVSMGAQTFDDARLHFLRRRHRSDQVSAAVARLRKAGINNISIDLMYGFPNETLEEWQYDIDQALSLHVEHLSAYALQYEEGTPLFKMLEQGQVSEIDEELSRRMYYELVDRLASAGYEHYEISNWAKGYKQYRSRHNSSYWNQTPYLGLGAAAHSFDGLNRQWNVADIQQYMGGVEMKTPRVECEVLSDDNHYNEIVMTALRTSDGLDVSLLKSSYADYCLQHAQSFLNNHLLTWDGQRLCLTRDGLFVSDMIMLELMKV